MPSLLISLKCNTWHPTSYFDSCFYCLHFGQTFSNSFQSKDISFLTQLLTQLALSLDGLVTGLSRLILKYKEVHQTKQSGRNIQNCRKTIEIMCQIFPLFISLEDLSDNPLTHRETHTWYLVNNVVLPPKHSTTKYWSWFSRLQVGAGRLSHENVSS